MISVFYKKEYIYKLILYFDYKTRLPSPTTTTDSSNTSVLYFDLLYVLITACRIKQKTVRF